MVKAVKKQVDVAQDSRPLGYLVIRMGKLFPNDPIKEIDSVIKQKKRAYFAKFGKPIGKFKAEAFLNKHNAYLVVVSFNQNKYDYKTYKFLTMTTKLPNDVGNSFYPKYYRGNEHFVGSWVEVSESDHQVDIAKLIVKSSYQKLTSVMGSAMGSCFFCTA